MDGRLPEHAAAFDDISRLWQAAAALDDAALHEARARASAAAPAGRRRPVQARRWALGLAAALVLALGGAALLRPPAADLGTRVLSTAIGERRQLQLDDGSTIELDAASEVTVRYAPGQRNIAIERGRAFFDVAHQPERPFVVSAGGVDSRALGTRFAVSRGAHGAVSVTVMEGRVRVSTTGTAGEPSQQRDIGRDQRIAYAPGRGMDGPRDVNAGMATAWRDGAVVYQSEPLSQVIDDLNRYSRRPVRLQHPDLGTTEVTGLWKLGDIDAWIDGLAASLELEVRRTQDAIVLERPAPPPAH